MFRVVLDSNVYISALCFSKNSPPSLTLTLAIQDEYELWSSAAIILEISKKLDEKFKWDAERIKQFVKLIGREAQIASPVEKIDVITNDPDDNRVLECADESNAHFIVTGDKHLLALVTYKNINILTPAAFINLFKK